MTKSANLGRRGLSRDCGHTLDAPISGDELLAQRAEALARIVRGERQALSRQEQEGVLRHRLSYLANDLVIPTWNAAFVYDTEAGATAALEMFEFANSQLLQFRYYDELLDSELGRIYDRLQDPRWWNNLAGRATSAPRSSCTRCSSTSTS